MHELHICLNIIDLLQEQSDKHHFTRVKTLRLEIGDLAGIEIEALKFSFPIAASRSSVAKAVSLEIISIPGRAWCEFCRVDVRISAHFAPCPTCDGYDYHITQGNELRISTMEVE